jgi:hypothetical protein
MKQKIANALMLLAIVHILFSFASLFHIGTEGLSNITCDRLAAAFLVIGSFYCIISLRIQNQLNQIK